jgi:hypothetical protein
VVLWGLGQSPSVGLGAELPSKIGREAKSLAPLTKLMILFHLFLVFCSFIDVKL